MQKEETQYRKAITISSRAVENKAQVRDVVQESEFQKIEVKQSLIAYIGDIIKKRRKVEMENRSIQQERLKVSLNIILEGCWGNPDDSNRQKPVRITQTSEYLDILTCSDSISVKDELVGYLFEDLYNSKARKGWEILLT